MSSRGMQDPVPWRNVRKKCMSSYEPFVSKDMSMKWRAYFTFNR